MKKVFNWSELHLSEMTSYKIHTLGGGQKNRYLCTLENQKEFISFPFFLFEIYVQFLLYFALYINYQIGIIS